MALTTRTNGSTSGNIIQASWFNDFKDLLTGVMTTQPVTIANTVTVSGVLTASAGLTVTTGGVTISAGGLSVTGATSFPGGVTMPNTIALTLAATTGTNASLYCNASNDFIVHAGNSNKVSIVSNTGIAQLIVDTGASLITAVQKIQANGGVGFITGTLSRMNGNLSSTASGTFNHLLGAAPVSVFAVSYGNSPISYMGTDNYTSTQFRVTEAGSSTWQALAIV